MTTEAGNDVVIGTTGNGHQLPHRNHDQEHASLATNETTNFAAQLFNGVRSTNGSKDRNLIISPMLLEATLALLYLGSDGTTAEQLRRLLRLNQRYANNAKMANYYATQLATATRGVGSIVDATTAAPSTHIEMRNKIILPANYEIADEFRKIAQKYFHTQANTQAAAADATLTQICGKDYATYLTSKAAVAIVATDFQNKWFLPFSAYRTGLYDFHSEQHQQQQQQPQQQQEQEQSSPGTRTTSQVAKPVAMLFDDDMFVKFGEFRELDARAIELPYEWHDEDDELSMLLVLPNRRDGLMPLLEELCKTDLRTLTERMQMESVQVLLPKFKIDYECSLRECADQLEISTIFNKESNFKNLLHESCQQSLQFEDVLHRACIEVNESGTETSKSTAALKPIVISNSLNGGKKFFRADHPFFFAVRNSEAVYFMGQVTSF